MVTIGNLEVNFDVEGESDEITFARLFEKYDRKKEDARERERRLKNDRSLGDHNEGSNS
jgi:hypothetical protein